MTEEWLKRSDREKWRVAGIALAWIASCIVHQIISLVGIPVLSAFLTFTLCSIAQSVTHSVPSGLASKLLTQIPGFPIQAILGFLLGLSLGNFSQRRVMMWVWVLPLILFCIALLFSPLNGSSQSGPLYPPEAHHKSTLLEQLSWSILFIPSAAYSLGAKSARPRHNKIE